MAAKSTNQTKKAAAIAKSKADKKKRLEGVKNPTARQTKVLSTLKSSPQKAKK